MRKNTQNLGTISVLTPGKEGGLQGWAVWRGKAFDIPIGKKRETWGNLLEAEISQ